MGMKFKRAPRDEPEINLIPFIDVLLVVLIFLMLTTTYNRFTELKITLPVANAENPPERPREILVSVTADGLYAVDRKPVDGRQVEQLVAALAAAANGAPDSLVVVSADAAAAHQSVINVMDAARRANLPKLTFATQASAGAGGR
jgi:biopolymer transport protein ExbD